MTVSNRLPLPKARDFDSPLIKICPIFNFKAGSNSVKHITVKISNDFTRGKVKDLHQRGAGQYWRGRMLDYIWNSKRLLRR